MNSKKLNTLYLLIVVISISLFGIYKYSNTLSTKHGVVRANIIKIAPQISGKVSSVSVINNQKIKKGDELFKIEDKDYLLALQQAKINLSTVKKDLNILDSQIISSQTSVDIAKEQYQHTLREFNRAKSLNKNKYISSTEYDSRLSKLKIASNLVKKSQANLKEIIYKRGLLNSHNIEIQKANIKLEQALLNMKRTTVYSPVDGYITTVNIHQGDYIHIGDTVLGIVDTSHIWIEGAYPETVIDNIEIGDKAKIVLMSNRSKVYYGKVINIGSAIDSKELPMPSSIVPKLPQVFDWVRLAENIPVDIQLDNKSISKNLIPGQTVNIDIIKDEN